MDEQSAEMLRNIAKHEQATAGVHEFARVVLDYYFALTDRGLKPEHALVLANSFQSIILANQTQGGSR